ncbi:BET1-like protein isoform X4 [Aotus nancymaae]|uniref:BET1-like protein isoform X4 n=1 Tax=Aotus nancymaae TaxID=37293 RepID=UPI0030FEAFC9
MQPLSLSLFSAQSPGAVEEILDRENKRMTDTLASKVTRLKSLALDIDRDAEDQNRYLDGMVRACPSTPCCRACSVSSTAIESRFLKNMASFDRRIPAFLKNLVTFRTLSL